jgi:hypothetical protein
MLNVPIITPVMPPSSSSSGATLLELMILLPSLAYFLQAIGICFFLIEGGYQSKKEVLVDLIPFWPLIRKFKELD